MPNLYTTNTYSPKHCAQGNLGGRTHYVDDATLRWHKSRIVSARAVDNGLLFAIVESVALDTNNTRRGFRYVVFDVFGHVLSRVDLEDCWRTGAQASKAMWAYLNTIDAKAITLEAIKRERKSHERELAELAAVCQIPAARAA